MVLPADTVPGQQLRIEHNKSRQRLKHLLNTASQGGPTVQQQDLYLASQLAKMDMSLAGLDPASSPRKGAIPLARIHKQLQYPPLHGRGAFGELPPTRAERKLRENLKNTQNEDINLMSAAKAGDLTHAPPRLSFSRFAGPFLRVLVSASASRRLLRTTFPRAARDMPATCPHPRPTASPIFRLNGRAHLCSD